MAVDSPWCQTVLHILCFLRTTSFPKDKLSVSFGEGFFLKSSSCRYTSSHHGPYMLGYTCVTIEYTINSLQNIYKEKQSILFLDLSLQLGIMKPEL
jgi:hypothetical protein